MVHSLIAPLPLANQADGFTYERSAIEQWLETHRTPPPATGAALESKQLIQCRPPRPHPVSLIQIFKSCGETANMSRGASPRHFAAEWSRSGSA